MIDTISSKIVVETLSWFDYEYNISECYDGDASVEKLKSSHRIASRKLGELVEALGFNSLGEVSDFAHTHKEEKNENDCDG